MREGAYFISPLQIVCDGSEFELHEDEDEDMDVPVDEVDEVDEEPVESGRESNTVVVVVVIVSVVAVVACLALRTPIGGGGGCWREGRVKGQRQLTRVSSNVAQRKTNFSGWRTGCRRQRLICNGRGACGSAANATLLTKIVRRVSSRKIRWQVLLLFPDGGSCIQIAQFWSGYDPGRPVGCRRSRRRRVALAFVGVAVTVVRRHRRAG
jgi:hypothetical protein